MPVAAIITVTGTMISPPPKNATKTINGANGLCAKPSLACASDSVLT